MYRVNKTKKIYNFFLGCFLLIFCTTVFANENLENGVPEVARIVESHIDLIKKDKTYEGKHKKLVQLIDMINKEFNNYSNIVTDLKIKIIEKNGNVKEEVIKEKDKNEKIYSSWVAYRTAFEPTYELFVEKNGKYHCDAFAEEVWQDYHPRAPTSEKMETEMDTYSQNAVKLSIEIATHLCQNRSKVVAE